MKTIQQIIQKQYQRGMTVVQLARLHDADLEKIYEIVKCVPPKSRTRRADSYYNRLNEKKAENRRIAEFKNQGERKHLAKRIEGMYYLQVMNKKEIAHALKISQWNVTEIAKEHGVELSFEKRDEMLLSKIEKMLKKGVSRKEICEELNITRSVYSRLKGDKP